MYLFHLADQFFLKKINTWVSWSLQIKQIVSNKIPQNKSYLIGLFSHIIDRKYIVNLCYSIFNFHNRSIFLLFNDVFLKVMVVNVLITRLF